MDNFSRLEPTCKQNIEKTEHIGVGKLYEVVPKPGSDARWLDGICAESVEKKAETNTDYRS